MTRPKDIEIRPHKEYPKRGEWDTVKYCIRYEDYCICRHAKEDHKGGIFKGNCWTCECSKYILGLKKPVRYYND